MVILTIGLTNAVPALQRVINEFIANHNLKCVNAYLENITVGGMTQKEHDDNLAALRLAAEVDQFTFNEEKSQCSCTEISLLRYRVGGGVIKPDPQRVKALQDLPTSTTKKELQRIMGLFAYYAKWIPYYSATIRPLTKTEKLPLDDEARQALNTLKDQLARASLHPIDESIPFTVETDASDFAIAATLNQNGRPVAFHARTLSVAEQKHSAIEKEACAIVEALRKWRHLLMGRHFNLVTDQRSLSFMFDLKHPSKVKNDKIQRWRLELSPYDFSAIYRPGNKNNAADTFSRAISASVVSAAISLKSLHDSLCHPGITRMWHYVKTKNLPHSFEEVKAMVKSCKDCAEVKTSFYKPEAPQHLIKATQPFERVSIEFKGPVASVTKNKYLLVIVDEFSRFPFVYPCVDMKASTIIEKLCNLFSLFGFPGYVRTDQGSNFMSSELKGWLNGKGIPTSRSTRYSPKGNGQVERFNGVIWKSVILGLRVKNLPTSIGKLYCVMFCILCDHCYARPQIVHHMSVCFYTCENLQTG